MNTTQVHITLRVLLRREWDGEREKWAAQCLEHDVATQGKDLDEVQTRFVRIVSGYIHLAAGKRHPLSHLKPAPQEYHRMWKKAKPLRDPLPVGKSTRSRVTEAEFSLAA